MHAKKKSLTEILKKLADVHENKLPFNKVLGLRIKSMAPGGVRVVFDMKPKLVGYNVHGALNSGVISSALDATGSIVACIGIVVKLQKRPTEEILSEIWKVGTIDLRVDYLRPGLGECFYATGKVMRSARKVTVIRMELHNDSEKKIAVGTGTYIVG